jgi:uncharacterized protein
MAKTIPVATINYEVYLDGDRLLGTVQITQPDIQAMTVEMKGSGISGVTEEVIAGHFQAMSGTLQFRTVTEDSAKLLQSKYHHLEFWADVQTQDSATGENVEKQHKIIWRAKPKNLKPGTIGVGELQNREIEFGIVYYKEFFDNKQLFELDKYNYIYKVGEEDLLANARKILGL